jgi:type IV pilus assembly protein PilV
MSYSNPRQNAGFGMIEVLVSLVIILIGLLGLAGLLTYGQQAEMESYQRSQALVLLQDMEWRLNANRKVASCYAITPVGDGTRYLGVAGISPAGCAAGTAQENATADADLTAWDNELKGAAEKLGSNIGAMIGARGCIEQTDAANNIYLISVAWQGLNPSFAPTAGLTCAKQTTSLYGSDDQRRVVSTTVRIANLTAP